MRDEKLILEGRLLELKQEMIFDADSVAVLRQEVERISDTSLSLQSQFELVDRNAESLLVMHSKVKRKLETCKARAIAAVRTEYFSIHPFRKIICAPLRIRQPNEHWQQTLKCRRYVFELLYLCRW